VSSSLALSQGRRKRGQNQQDAGAQFRAAMRAIELEDRRYFGAVNDWLRHTFNLAMAAGTTHWSDDPALLAFLVQEHDRWFPENPDFAELSHTCWPLTGRRFGEIVVPVLVPEDPRISWTEFRDALFAAGATRFMLPDTLGGWNELLLVYAAGPERQRSVLMPYPMPSP
jgi:hypothetical protein